MPFDNDRDEQEQNLLRSEMKDSDKSEEKSDALKRLSTAIHAMDESSLWCAYFDVKRILEK